ncbi:MAG: FAD-dependent oxidoreductase [candidate division FCPU426 bacterium]
MALEFKLDLPVEAGLKPGEEQDQVFELAIVGGGPAGMTAAVYALRKQLKIVMITPDLGGQVLWTGGVENYMGYQYISGPDLASKFSEQVRHFPLKLAQGESVTAVEEKAGPLFVLATNTGRTISARSLLIATGKRQRPLNVPGEKEYQGRGVSFCSICDGPFFKGLPVVVVGGGNSGISAALDMLELNSPVTVINFADGWQADPVLLDQVRGRAKLLDGHQLVAIEGEGGKVTGVAIRPRGGGPEQHVEARGVFIEVGLLPNTEFCRGLVELTPHGEIRVDDRARTSRPGVFAAGDCTTVPEKQIIIAAGEGAKAALTAYRYIKRIPD